MATRPYSSPRRTQAAQATRAAIIDVAERLYVEQGFTATTLDEIAAEAEVAPATVKNVFGTKRGLLEAVLRARLVGDADGAPLTARAEWQALLEEPNPLRLLERFVEMASELHARSAGIIEAVVRAGSADAELADLAQRGAEKRHADLAEIIVALERRSALRNGLGKREATDVLWALTSPFLFRQLTHERGWSPGRWSTFTLDGLRAGLLEDPA